MREHEQHRPPAAHLRSADELDALYRRLSLHLERIVRRGVRAPDPVIEDACQVAWTRLIQHSERIRRDTALAWLAVTALHEALRLVRRDGRELSLEAHFARADDASLHPLTATTEEIFQRRSRLASLRELPERQQRLLWLQALGLTQAEMALHEGCTNRTVERQLLKARQGIRRAAAAEL